MRKFVEPLADRHHLRLVQIFAKTRPTVKRLMTLNHDYKIKVFKAAKTLSSKVDLLVDMFSALASLAR